MPHTEGSTWTYALEIEQQRQGAAGARSSGEITYKIDASKTRGDETDFLLGIYQEGKKKDEQMWRAGPKGIFQVSMGPTRRAFDPPQPVVILPVKTGVTYKWKGTTRAANGRSIASELAGQAIGFVTADTDMGPADALLVESQSVFDAQIADGKKVRGGTVTDTWFRPGVGIVRYKQVTQAATGALSYTLRLKSYKISGS